MKRILFVYFTNSGQTESVVKNVLKPFEQAEHVLVTVKKIKTKFPFPYPWSILSFFNEFPNAVMENECDIEPLHLENEEKFDLIVLCYPVWFLSIATPFLSFLKSQESQILKDTPVITLITCRNMWSQAQTRMQMHLKNRNAKLVGNIVLRDRSGNKPITYVTTPLWLLTGKKKISKYVPDAGIDPQRIEKTSEYGKLILDYLGRMDPAVKPRDDNTNLLQNKVPSSLALSEKIGRSLFLAWGFLILKISKPKTVFRDLLIVLFLCFLLATAIFCLPMFYLFYSVFQKVTKAPTFKQVVQNE